MESWRLQMIWHQAISKHHVEVTMNTWLHIISSTMPITLEPLTHWGRVTHICVNKLTIVGSDNGLSPGRRQAIIGTIAGILLIGPLGTNFSEILIGIQTFSFKIMHLKMSSGKWRPSCLGLNVLRPLTRWGLVMPYGIRIVVNIGSACCQCWLVIREVLWHSPEGNVTGNA